MISIFSKIQDFQRRITVSQVAPVLFVIALFLMWIVNGTDMPFSLPHIKKLSGGAGIPDVLFSYTASDLYRMLNALSPAGRHAYTNMLIYFDFMFPALYSLALSTSIAALYKKSDWSPVLRRIPYFAGLFDWLENICILTALFYFPKTVSIASFAGYATTAKYSFMVISLLILCFGVLQKGFLSLKSVLAHC